MRFLLLLAVVWTVIGLGAAPLWADTIPQQQYTTHDGLPSTHITALSQTNNGLLWVGTTRGLVVYDGRTFRPVSMPDSIVQTTISALHPMPDGSVWAGVGHDVVRAAPHGVQEHYALDHHSVAEIVRRGDRVRFVTHQAVWSRSMDRDTLSGTRFRYETLTGVTQVWGADVGPEGHLWIVNSTQGPGRVGPTGRVTFADPPAPPAEPPRQGAFFGLQFGPDGTALVAHNAVARTARLYRFDPEASTFTEIGATPGPANTIHHQDGVVYLTRTARVSRFDTQTRRFLEPLDFSRNRPTMTTTEILRGREGGLWVGTQESGLLHLPAPDVRHVTSIDGHSMKAGAGFRTHGDALWANTWGDGLFQLRPQRRWMAPDGNVRWVFPRSHAGGLHGLTPDPSGGRAWYRWTPAGGWQFVAHAATAVRGYVDTAGVGYFWHNQGLYRHVPAGDTTARTRLRTWPVGESQHHLMGPALNGDPIVFDEGTVLRLRRADGAVLDTIAHVPEHATSCGRRLTVDAGGRIWAPFHSLLRIDPQEPPPQTLLEGAALESVVMAGDSLAMAKTNEGLYLLNAHTGSVRRHLTTGDGLLSNDVNGAHLTADTLYVGHPSGLSLLPTDALFAPPSRPHAVLTGLEVNFEERSLAASPEWSAEERTAGVSYTAASLAHPDRVRFEVRLAPRDSTWKSTDRRFARYTDLTPDTYRFEVRARLEGHPPGPATTYSFTVPPQTWWFRVLVGLGLLGLGIGAYRWRTHRLRARQEELEAAVHARTEELKRAKETTERQAERLQELDEAKSRFFARVSHEFRTPLSLLFSPLRDAARRDEGLDPEQVERMLPSAERLRRLIDQLLDLATLDAGGMELDCRPADLAALVERTAEAFRSKTERDGIDLRVERPDAGLPTRFDAEKVETIVSNLVANALTHTPEGGAVTVRLRRAAAPDRVDLTDSGSAACIEVADTGPGIPEETQEDIFDAFAQGASESASTDGAASDDGLGLGLALTRELAELHGGTVDLQSTPGEGSTFCVWLPLVPTDRADATVAPDRSDAPRFDGPGGDGSLPDGADLPRRPTAPNDEIPVRTAEAEVLVVEDNDDMRALLCEHLSAYWTVREAATGEAAWTQIQNNAPDLVLTDVMMPGLDGFALCQKIKDDAELRTLPVVLLTARTADDDTIEGLECGADDYVAKPFDLDELVHRLDNHLATRDHLRDRYQQEVRIEPIEAVVDDSDVPFVEDVLEAIEDHLADPDFTARRLSDAVALSRRQLTRRLKKAVGETPAAFIRQRRIQRAQELLADRQTDTVAQVAYAVGFRSPSHFSQVFQDATGCTPTDYQKTHGASA
jgi:signal transduction histidine kinase/DNA-binding response OmpR family regulator/streptogramin lyase